MWIKSAGIVLIILGITMISYTGFTYITTKKVVDIGTIQVNQKDNHTVQWHPYVGVVLLVVGVVIIVGGKKNRT